MPRWFCPEKGVVPLIVLDPQDDGQLGRPGYYEVDGSIGGYIGALRPPHGTWVRIGDFEALRRGTLLRHAGIQLPKTVSLNSPSLQVPRALVQLISPMGKRFLDLHDLPEGCLDELACPDFRKDGDESLLWFHRIWLTLGLSHQATCYSSATDWNRVLASLAALGLVRLTVGMKYFESSEDEWDLLSEVLPLLPWIVGALEPNFLDDELQDDSPRQLLQDRVAPLIEESMRSTVHQLGRHYLRIQDAYDELRVSFPGRVRSTLNEDRYWKDLASGPRPEELYASDLFAEGELVNILGPTFRKPSRDPAESEQRAPRATTFHGPASIKDLLGTGKPIAAGIDPLASWTGPLKKRHLTQTGRPSIDNLNEPQPTPIKATRRLRKSRRK